MIAVGDAVDEVQGFIEFFRTIVRGAVNERVNRGAVERSIVVTTGALRGKSGVAGLDKEFAVGIEEFEEDRRGNPTKNRMGEIAEADTRHDEKGRAGDPRARPLEMTLRPFLRPITRGAG